MIHSHESKQNTNAEIQLKCLLMLPKWVMSQEIKSVYKYEYIFSMPLRATNVKIGISALNKNRWQRETQSGALDYFVERDIIESNRK